MKTAAKQAAAENQKALLTFTVTMAALPDGTRYPGSTVLSIPASQIEVRVTKSNYQKLAQ